MKILNEDYRRLKPDEDCLKLLPIEFVEKYHCLIYSRYEEGIVVLVNNNFEYSNISKLNYFIKEQLYLSLINNEEWMELIKLIKLSQNRNQAINKFQINSDIISQKALNDNSKVLYKAEIENAPIVKIIDSIIEEAITLKCSDIHFEPYENAIKVKMRIDGKLLDKTSLPINSLDEVATRIKVLSNLDITKKYFPQDGKLIYNYNEVDYDIRVSLIPSIYGERIALRILDVKRGYLNIDELGFLPSAKELINKMINATSGLILVVGPTGSGKSTTLQAFLSKNLERNENIITVEDPVEYSIEGISQIQINEEAGLDFAVCLRTILRQDPNIIMIGEIRDLETAKIACRASITGHLVYSTLHTNSSIGVINRLKDMDIESFLLVDALKGIISQRLVRCLCNHCKKKVNVSNEEAKILNVDLNTTIFKAQGCGHCNLTGYKGRRGIYEVILVDEDFRKLIIENAPSNKFWKLIKKKNYKTIADNAIQLVLDGITTIEEIQSVLD